MVALDGKYNLVSHNRKEGHMEKDINSLSGIEFENLCQQLLQKMEFDTETTKASGDGGIDIIARYNKPLLKGKYIIQCKRYSGSVGEPIIRDLYGVVMSERANKGILMTTGYFTPSAIAFAEDKNLELVDGILLQKLLYDNGFDVADAPKEIKSFLTNTQFDINKYNFYKEMIAQNMCTEEMGQDLINFLFEYFVNPNGISDWQEYRCQSKMVDCTDIFETMVNSSVVDEDRHEIIYYGLCDEFARIFDWFTSKYYKKGKEKLEMLPYRIERYKGIVDLYSFELFEYVKQRYLLLKNLSSVGLRIMLHTNPDNMFSYKWFYLDKDDRTAIELHKGVEVIMQNLDNKDVLRFHYSRNYCELLNLYSIFKFFNVEKGVKHIEDILWNGHRYKDDVLTVLNVEKLFILCRQKPVVIFPNIQMMQTRTNTGKWKFDGVELFYCNLLDLEAYYNKYSSQKQDKINMEIIKIENLLETL